MASKTNSTTLTIKDRLLISQLYPKEGNIIEQTLIRDIRRKVEIDAKEQKRIGLKSTPNGFAWDNKKVKVLKVDFSDSEVSLLKTQIERLDKEKKITQQNLELCLKIKNI